MSIVQTFCITLLSKYYLANVYNASILHYSVI